MRIQEANLYQSSWVLHDFFVRHAPGLVSGCHPGHGHARAKEVSPNFQDQLLRRCCSWQDGLQRRGSRKHRFCSVQQKDVSRIPTALTELQLTATRNQSRQPGGPIQQPLRYDRGVLRIQLRSIAFARSTKPVFDSV